MRLTLVNYKKNEALQPSSSNNLRDDTLDTRRNEEKAPWWSVTSGRKNVSSMVYLYINTRFYVVYNNGHILIRNLAHCILG